MRVHPTADYAGKRFGRLLVLLEAESHIGRSGDRHRQWPFRCDCGNTKEYTTSVLTSDRVCSCDCHQAEQRQQRMKDNVSDMYNGTNISRIRKRTLRRNNTTGVRGVHRALGPTPQGDRWIDMIGVQCKRFYLDCFHSLEDAVKARRVAEEQYFERLIEGYASVGVTDS